MPEKLVKYAAAWVVLFALVDAAAAETITQRVLLITLDGLRWQELFGGVDARLLNRDLGGVRDIEVLRTRYQRESREESREALMPFFWQTIATQGQVFGDVESDSEARATNGRFFSYPGYNEILSGFPDPRIDSNAKRANENVTVLEWLHDRPGFRGQVAAFCSWDVFPFILNVDRSGIYVNAGWDPLEVFRDASQRQQWNKVAAELPRVWSGVRYDAFTIRGALEYLRVRQPRGLYVALGETDDWAHEGRYDLYLDAAHRCDQYIERLWRLCQELNDYRGKTSLVITTDHGRGDVRGGWKSHGVSQPGSENIWIAVMGPDTPPIGTRSSVKVTQGQVAATVAALLGEDFGELDSRVARPLPGVIEQ